jgi:hypothetical protein
VALREVSEHRGERLQDTGVVTHGGIDAREHQSDERTAGIDAPRRFIRRLHQADLRLCRKAGEDVFNLGERIAHIRKLTNSTVEHLNERIGPFDRRGHRRQGSRQHPSRCERRHVVLVRQGTSPGLEQRTERETAMPDAPADNRLDTRLECYAQVGARLQGVHRSGEGSHRGRRICARVTIRAVPSIQVIKKGREPRRLLGTGATRLDDDRCIELHDSPFLPVPLSPRGLLCAT